MKPALASSTAAKVVCRLCIARACSRPSPRTARGASFGTAQLSVAARKTPGFVRPFASAEAARAPPPPALLRLPTSTGSLLKGLQNSGQKRKDGNRDNASFSRPNRPSSLPAAGGLAQTRSICALTSASAARIARKRRGSVKPVFIAGRATARPRRCSSRVLRAPRPCITSPFANSPAR